MFKNQPAGLYVLSLANTGERFGYYTMLAIFLLFLQAKFGFDSSVSGQIYAGFLAMVYFMPLVGGWVADKWSFSKCVVAGIAVMFIGYAIMSIPTPVRMESSLVILIVALVFIALGTGLFKGNLQVMVGDLYNEAKYSGMRDAAFSLFYMAINIGSMFAPMAATSMCNWALHGNEMEYNAEMATMSNWYIDTDGFTDFGNISKSKLEEMQDFAAESGVEGKAAFSLYTHLKMEDKAESASVNATQVDNMFNFISDQKLKNQNLGLYLNSYFVDYVAPMSVNLPNAEKDVMTATNKLMKPTNNFTVMPTDEKVKKELDKIVKKYGLDAANPLPAIVTLREPAMSIISTRLSSIPTYTYVEQYIETLSDGYSRGFAVACFSLIVSFCIYFLGRKSYAHIIVKKKKGEKTAAAAENLGPQLSPKQVKARVVALLLVFAVVIFFWMVFHQNGATLTEFAKSCTADELGGWTRIGFNVWALLIIAVAVYALFNLFQSKGKVSRIVSVVLIILAAGGLFLIYRFTDDPVTGIQPQQYQQFNPFYVVALTPVSLAFFGWLANRKKEPSAPRKIGYGMLMAGVAYALMCIGSFTIVGTSGSVSPNWLITTYLLLTFAELLLSPMGISFVSKVAPPKLKGSMMGGWFAATAVGNYLVSIPMILWGKIPVWTLWGILIIICLISAVFIFSIMKKLEAATSDDPGVDPAAQELANAAENE